MGKTIRVLRTEANPRRTIAQLSAEAGLSKSHLHALETGRATVTIEVAERIGLALGFDLLTFIHKFLDLRARANPEPDNEPPSYDRSAPTT